jgi:hypothetical protein
MVPETQGGFVSVSMLAIGLSVDWAVLSFLPLQTPTSKFLNYFTLHRASIIISDMNPRSRKGEIVRRVLKFK